jgi:hypothetical protein
MARTKIQNVLCVVFIFAILIAAIATVPWSLFEYTPTTSFDFFTSLVIIIGGSFAVFFPFMLISIYSKKNKTNPLLVGLIFSVVIGSYLTTLLFGISTLYFMLIGVFGLVIVMILKTQAELIANRAVRADYAAAPRDPSKIKRVIMDTYNEEEIIIHGLTSDTFRSACRRNWNFSSIGRDTPWIIQDERGNDITELKLTEYHGIAYLVSQHPMDSGEMYYQEHEESTDRSDQYSDMDQGVELYD